VAKPRSEKKSEPTAPAERRVLPMELQVGDRLTDETGEWEVIGRPYTTAARKNAHVRVKCADSDITMIRTYGAHEQVSVKRATAEEGKRCDCASSFDRRAVPARLGLDGQCRGPLGYVVPSVRRLWRMGEWTPLDQFDTKDDCSAAVARALAGIRPPDRLAGNAMQTRTPSGGALYTRPVCFAETFDPHGPKGAGR
jgi:hypothetical protein